MTSDSINLLPIYYQEYISDPSSIQSANKLNDLLRFHATRLAKQAQQSVTSQDESPSPQLIDCLSTLWSLSSSQIDLDSIETHQGQERIKLAISALLLSRNLVAGSRQAQNAVYRQVISLLQLLHQTSSFASLNSPKLQPVTRIAVQLLANLITGNEPLQKDLWSKITDTWQNIGNFSTSRFMEAKSGDFANLFSRILASPDSGTLTAIQVLILNCCKSSYARSLSLCNTLEGIRILASFLNTAEAAVEEDETEEERLETENLTLEERDQSQGERLSQKLGIIYPILTHLFSLRLFSKIFQNLSLALTSSIVEEEEQEEALGDLTNLITEQLTLLKLLDSYLHFKTSWIDYGDENLVGDFPADQEEKDLEILIDWFLKVSRIAQNIMLDSMNVNEDPEKPKTGEMKRLQESKLESSHKVLVLTLQCLIAICVSTEGENAKQRFEESFKSLEVEDENQSSNRVEGIGLIREGQKVLERMRLRKSGVVEEAVALLQVTSKYSPAISPFRPYQSGPAPEAHSLTSTGSAPPIPIPASGSSLNSNANQDTIKNATTGGGLAYLKRDLVRLLGVLAYSPPKRYKEENEITSKTIKDVQDRVRELGGLFDVLNLTNLDELNPYIREHAIFTLRNLLASNQESQDLVAKLRPLESNGSSNGA